MLLNQAASVLLSWVVGRAAAAARALGLSLEDAALGCPTASCLLCQALCERLWEQGRERSQQVKGVLSAAEVMGLGPELPSRS